MFNFIYYYSIRSVAPGTNCIQSFRGKKDDSSSNSSASLFHPVPVKPNPDDINIGAELTGVLKKTDLLKILNSFVQKKEIKELSQQYGLDSMC